MCRRIQSGRMLAETVNSLARAAEAAKAELSRRANPQPQPAAKTERNLH